ncbi:MAG TPA: LysR family transcriptional regulator [Denitromonas sp.]|uniref:LysR family transcriptional regulator n=1 Tax=Denitromonas sp. TaxID=2734609 RepID=UPI001D2E0F61|nr:LysR family transcriptional regulator [Rhodocyclaceae bacterium]MCP5220881.1 LysR family transcriptional regulator [Zoogloeaceae bacterium]HPR06467.1 LysR family transcriptional regulator [Denitromonas sp.]HQU89337.1 LysR family transcriptional regulator [Denitromonas sp.]HQV14988.1 LysR family transcriptional regulator [Denitromonas sp.]
MDRLEAMRAFCAVVESGGFAAAAARSGASTSAVSRHVAQLEAHLNVRLLSRTTRKVSTTDAGQAYFERCLQLLADLEETDAVVAGEARRPTGRLRVSAPIALSIHRLAPAFAAFQRRFPEVTLDIALSDGVADFVDEGLDLAIRVGRLGSDNLVARRIDTARLVLAASPAYLKDRGVPAHPEALVEHNCLGYSYAATGNLWQFESAQGETCSVRISGSVRANNGMLLAEMAASGDGVVHVPDFLAKPLLDSGRLVVLLPAWSYRELPIHAVYPSRRYLSAKVQAMVGFLTDWFAAGDAT